MEQEKNENELLLIVIHRATVNGLMHTQIVPGCLCTERPAKKLHQAVIATTFGDCKHQKSTSKVQK